MPFQYDRLRGLRDSKGLSQPQLAGQAGLSQSVIAKTEAGSNTPGADVLEKLAEALECTTDYLLGRGPGFGNPAMAAAHMSLDVFIARQHLTDEQREACRRILQHPDAPRTSQAWRSLSEMLEMATASHPYKTPVSVTEEHDQQRKPMALPRRIHRHS